MNVKYLWMSLIIILFCGSSWAETSAVKEQKKAIQRLEKRKQAYESWKKKQAVRDVSRLAAVGKQKKLRKNYQASLEKARKNFDREERKFPIKAYRNFLQRRDQLRKEHKSERENYVKLQRKLEKIHDKPRYRINKMEEYKL